MSQSAKRTCGTSDLSVLRDVNVLVVEDNWQVAKALECALKQLEMQVSGPASTTSDAKRLVAAIPIYPLYGLFEGPAARQLLGLRPTNILSYTTATAGCGFYTAICSDPYPVGLSQLRMRLHCAKRCAQCCRNGWMG